MNNVLYVAHRINTSKELENISITHGVEIDLRNYGNDIILCHDPFDTEYELFENYLKNYKHKFIILNIKTEGIEYKVLELIKLYNIQDYLFLDCSFPMIYKLINLGENNIAIRFSELESIDTILNLKNKVKYVWVDCFTKTPLNKSIYKELNDNNFKIVLVSPELQNHKFKLELYKDYLIKNDIIPHMICTKTYNIKRWL